METLIEKILEYVDPEGPVTADSLLTQDCGLSSFDSACLVGELCAEYGVSEDDPALVKARTVGELYAALTGSETK